MTEIEAIITMARRYCIDNSIFWWKKHEFLRWKVLLAILKEVELLVNKKYRILSQCKKELLMAGEKCNAIITESSKNEIELMATTDEKNKFIEFIFKISEKDLSGVLPLPYNRKLTLKEVKSVLKKLNEAWVFDGGYWNPLKDKCKLETVFLMKDNFTDIDKEKIIDYLKKNNKRFYTLDENEYDYETEEIEIEGCETVYTNKKFEWIIYISHEETITFGGASLIDFVKNIFHDRKEKINNW